MPALTPGNKNSNPLDADGIRATIRSIIREESQKLLPVASPHVAAVTSSIPDELHQALGTALSNQTVMQPQPVPPPAVMS